MSSYGTGNKPTKPQLSNVCFNDPMLDSDLANPNAKNHDALIDVLICLSLCHQIVVDDKKGAYNAASPDELALVNAAKQFGYEFKGFD